MATSLDKLAKKHVEQLAAAINESKQVVEAHKAKITEIEQQIVRLEADKAKWLEALEDADA